MKEKIILIGGGHCKSCIDVIEQAGTFQIAGIVDVPGKLHQKILKITHSKSKVVFKPLPQDDPVRRCPDITLAKKKLNWQPKVGLEEGLGRTIEYFKSLS